MNDQQCSTYIEERTLSFLDYEHDHGTRVTADFSVPLVSTSDVGWVSTTRYWQHCSLYWSRDDVEGSMASSVEVEGGVWLPFSPSTLSEVSPVILLFSAFFYAAHIVNKSIVIDQFWNDVFVKSVSQWRTSVELDNQVQLSSWLIISSVFWVNLSSNVRIRWNSMRISRPAR